MSATEVPVGKFFSFAPTYSVSFEHLREHPVEVLTKAQGMVIGSVDMVTETISFHRRISLEEHQAQMGWLRDEISSAVSEAE